MPCDDLPNHSHPTRHHTSATGGSLPVRSPARKSLPGRDEGSLVIPYFFCHRAASHSCTGYDVLCTVDCILPPLSRRFLRLHIRVPAPVANGSARNGGWRGLFPQHDHYHLIQKHARCIKGPPSLAFRRTMSWLPCTACFLSPWVSLLPYHSSTDAASYTLTLRDGLEGNHSSDLLAGTVPFTPAFSVIRMVRRCT